MGRAMMSISERSRDGKHDMPGRLTEKRKNCKVLILSWMMHRGARLGLSYVSGEGTGLGIGTGACGQRHPAASDTYTEAPESGIGTRESQPWPRLPQRPAPIAADGPPSVHATSKPA